MVTQKLNPLQHDLMSETAQTTLHMGIPFSSHPAMVYYNPWCPKMTPDMRSHVVLALLCTAPGAPKTQPL